MEENNKDVVTNGQSEENVEKTYNALREVLHGNTYTAM